jgi:hypothetical protein
MTRLERMKTMERLKPWRRLDKVPDERPTRASYYQINIRI